MKPGLPLSLLGLLLAPTLFDATVDAFRLHIQGRRNVAETALRRRNSVHSDTLSNAGDISYYANLTLGGEEFDVLIDTGSSDLWVAGSVPSAKDTGKTSGVNYAIGAVKGPIKTADLEFDGHTVPDQAFLAINASLTNPAGKGLLGLGPISGSNIYNELDKKTAGAPVLDRIFLENTSTPNYLTVLLGRTEDPTDTYKGDISVGEVLDEFKDVTNQPKLSVTIVPVREAGDQHFQILVDADGIVGPDGQAISVNTEVDETSNKKQATAVVDTGFSLSQVPKTVADMLYSRYEGAEYVNVTGVGPVWIVPCDKEVNLTWKFSGQSFPMHPLDTTLNPGILGMENIENSDGEPCCIGTFQPMVFDTGNSPNYDIILGMSFLRNVYSLFDYGDFTAGNEDERDEPFIQFLSTTDPAEAHSDFVHVRLGGTDTTGDQVLLPATTSGDASSSSTKKKGPSRTALLIFSVIAFVSAILLAALAVFLWRRRRAQQRKGIYKALNDPPPSYPMASQSAPYQYSGSQQPPLYDPYGPQHPWDHRT